MEAHTDALSLFSSIPVNTAINSSQEIEHLPISQLSGGFIEFNINSQNYIDLSRSQIYLKCKIILGESDDIVYIDDLASFDEKGDVAPVNCMLGTIFQKVDFSLQQTSLNNDIPSYTHGYKYLLDTLLSGVDDDPSILFTKDTSAAINSCSIWKAFEANPDNEVEGNNIGLKERAKYVNRGQHFELQGALGIDFMKQNRLLIPDVNISVKLWQSSPEFSLLTSQKDKKFKLKIIEAKLKLRHVKLDPFVAEVIEEGMLSMPIQYPFISSKISTHSIAKGSQSCIINDVFSNHCPDQLYICMVTSTTSSGSFFENPFYLQHFNVSEIGFYLNNTSIPSRPLQLNFGESPYQSLYLEAWKRLLAHNKDIRISFEDFHRGYSIFSFDLSNKENSSIFTNPRKGTTKLEFRFSKALEQSVSVIIYGKFNTLLTIDKARHVALQ